ncbi:unnamed protein product, partial [Amoebophrya sp. A25]|eukprot:GSA25T00012105001.1
MGLRFYSFVSRVSTLLAVTLSPLLFPLSLLFRLQLLSAGREVSGYLNADNSEAVLQIFYDD